jgi:hypothetical protein
MTNPQPDQQRLGPGAPEAGSPQWRASMSIVVGAMAGSLVAMGAVLGLLGAELATPETWMLALVTLATVAAWAAVLLVLRPRGPGPSIAAAQTTVILRVAVLEAPALLGLVLAFLAEPTNLLLYLLPAAFSLLGIGLFARPQVVLDQLSRAA